MEDTYTRIHGSLDGLHEEIDAAVLSIPRPFEPGSYEPAGTSEKVVLAELFSGAECPPCVASDLAFDGLIERYDRDTLAVVEYHLHIPGPDPMTNSETEERADYYQASSTPSVFVDGVRTGRGGGPASVAERNFNLYKGSIESRLSELPAVSMSSLELTREEDTITVSGEITVSPDTASELDNAMLHLILAEDTIHYSGRNGIHFHHFVARKFMGPSGGLPLGDTSGEITFRESIALGDLTLSLGDYLDEYETEFQERISSFQWIEKLDEIDPDQLVVVAFVQDGVTQEVLQAAFAR